MRWPRRWLPPRSGWGGSHDRDTAKTTVAELAGRIPGPQTQRWPQGERFAVGFTHGSMLVELYVPQKVDPHHPHVRDELYIVVSGSGTFVCGDQRVAFAPHDVLFVRAGVEHRFVDYSADFKTWVVFYGPEGGEAQENVE